MKLILWHGDGSIRLLGCGIDHGAVLTLWLSIAAALSAQPRMRGDFDGDGRWTARDAEAALQMSVGLRSVDINLDVDYDGQVMSADARIILQGAAEQKTNQVSPQPVAAHITPESENARGSSSPTAAAPESPVTSATPAPIPTPPAARVLPPEVAAMLQHAPTPSAVASMPPPSKEHSKTLMRDPPPVGNALTPRPKLSTTAPASSPSPAVATAPPSATKTHPTAAIHDPPQTVPATPARSSPTPAVASMPPSPNEHSSAVIHDPSPPATAVTPRPKLSTPAPVNQPPKWLDKEGGSNGSATLTRQPAASASPAPHVSGALVDQPPPASKTAPQATPPPSAPHPEPAHITSAPPKRIDAAVTARPNIRGQHKGSYTYGENYGQIAGKSVRFTATIEQVAESEEFTGVIQEEYSGFGTPRNGSLWGDIKGTCKNENGSIRIRFQKKYRYFEQPPVSYEGTLSPRTGLLKGKWHISDSPANCGIFELDEVRRK